MCVWAYVLLFFYVLLTGLSMLRAWSSPAGVGLLALLAVAVCAADDCRLGVRARRAP